MARRLDDIYEQLKAYYQTHATPMNPTEAHSEVVLTEEELHAILDRRDVIAAAKGMVMQRFGVNVDVAFDLLRRLSQDTNTPVIDIARRLITVGDLKEY